MTLLAAGLVTLAIFGACGGDPAPTAIVEPPTSAGGVTVPATGPVPTDVAGSSGEPTVEPVRQGVVPSTGTVAAREQPAVGAATTPSNGEVPSAARAFPVPPDRDFFRLAKELIPGAGDVPRVVRQNAATLQAGHRTTFKLVDLDSRELYVSDFELKLVTPHAYWFVEDGVRSSKEAIERSAREFEEQIYPTVTAVFGNEWAPGVDGDPHLYVITAHLRGVGGYYSAADEYPGAIRPVSNEIEAIYINARYLPIGSDAFSHVIAHELQHAIHWNADLTEETWVNEGLSELAVSIMGYPEGSAAEFRRAGPTSLTQWPANDVGGAENYGAASLFLHYLTERYGGRENLRPLLQEASDGIPGINAYLQDGGHGVTFTDVFRDWAVANLLNEDTGRYGYSELSARFPVYQNLKAGDELSFATPQFANEYVRLEQLPSVARLSFEGVETAALLPEDTGNGCWWSNSGDVIDSTLTASVDLGGVDDPLLEFQVWFSIEEDWDFTYLEVSENGGQTWTILETPLTSIDDPLGVALGPGYTGASDGWQNESIPLSQWSGREILIRFQYITDAAIHDHGLCLRNIRLAGNSGELHPDAEWVPDGFAWTNNLVRQSFIVQVVYESGSRADNRVLQMELNDTNQGEMSLEAPQGTSRIVAIIQPMAPSTRMPANFTLRLEAIE